MYETHQVSESVRFRFSSDIVLVDRVVRESEHFLKSSGGGVHPVKSVLRELLINAVEHGNGNDASRHVDCEVTAIADDRFKVVVGDEGQGFDHSALKLDIPRDPYQERNRGFPLVNNLADQLEFNDAGNVITAYVSAVRETDYELAGENGWQVITPSGDITAGSVNNLRLLLLDLLERGHTRFRYDLRHVEDIDSVSISVLILFSKSLAGRSEEALLEIVNARRELVDLFRLTRLDRIFRVVETHHA